MPRRLLRFTMGLWLLAGLPLAARSAEGDWPTFRGASRTAVAPDTGLLSNWPSDGPELLWETDGMGRGYSSLAVADGRIYTMGDGLSIAPDKDEYLVCVNQADGKVLWFSKTGPAWSSGQESWQSSRSTPTVDGDHVYVLTRAGRVDQVLDRRTGSVAEGSQARVRRQEGGWLGIQRVGVGRR